MPDASVGDKALNIKITEQSNRSTGLIRKTAAITPAGFWGDIVTVLGSERSAFEPARIFVVYEISWGCGGSDGSLDNPAMVRNFIVALQKALELRAVWQREADAQVLRWPKRPRESERKS